MTGEGRRFLPAAAVALVLVLPTIAAACSFGDDARGPDIEGLGSSLTEIRRLARDEGALRLVSLPGYVDAAWTVPFAAQTGCVVEARTENDSAAIVELVDTGGYDGVSAPGDVSGELIDGGDVSSIAPERVSNFEQVSDAVKYRPFNSRDGVPYGVPIGRAPNLLVFRTDALPEDTESWSVIWDDARRLTGRLSIYDDAIFIADAALYLKATRPDLGIDDPYALNEMQLEAALGLLRRQKPHVGEYWRLDDETQIASFRSGASAVGTTRPARVTAMEREGIPVKAVKPREGTTGWSDTWMVLSQASNPNCMYLWMDYVLSPQVQARIAEATGQAPVNLTACALTTDPAHCAALHAEDETWWEDVWLWTSPAADCGDPSGEEVCTTLDDWRAAWTTLRQ